MGLSSKAAWAGATAGMAMGALATTASADQAPDAQIILAGQTCAPTVTSFSPNERDTRGVSNVLRDGIFTLTNRNPNVDFVWVEQGDHANSNGVVENSLNSGVGGINTSIPYAGGDGPMGPWGPSGKFRSVQSNGVTNDGTNTLGFRVPRNSEGIVIQLGDINGAVRGDANGDFGEQIHVVVQAPATNPWVGRGLSAYTDAFNIMTSPENVDNGILNVPVDLTGLSNRNVYITVDGQDVSYVISGADLLHEGCEYESDRNRDRPQGGKSEGSVSDGPVDGPDVSL